MPPSEPDPVPVGTSGRCRTLCSNLLPVWSHRCLYQTSIDPEERSGVPLTGTGPETAAPETAVHHGDAVHWITRHICMCTAWLGSGLTASGLSRLHSSCGPGGAGVVHGQCMASGLRLGKMCLRTLPSADLVIAFGLLSACWRTCGPSSAVVWTASQPQLNLIGRGRSLLLPSGCGGTCPRVWCSSIHKPIQLPNVGRNLTGTKMW
jgi:hypothetical protein